MSPLPRFLLIGLSLISTTALSFGAPRPADANANSKAREILTYLTGLEGRADKRLVSGQFTEFGDSGNLSLLQKVQAQTGHWPAIAGFDYMDFPKKGLSTHACNLSAIEYWRSGGLVTISTHLYNPANPNGGGLRDKGVDLNELLRVGTKTHESWMAELDTIAAGLQELKDAGVVVLWRPFHEMNGEWFWWGKKPPEDFIKVWRQMFDYFSKTKHLDNLLWVYGPNQGNNADDFYPGDDFVDLVGLDAYTDNIDPGSIKGYERVSAHPKAFGFSEYGPHAADNPPGDYDYRRFLAGVQHNFPRTVFFMSWNAKWSLASNHEVKSFLEQPWIVNLADLPPSLAGAPR
jgi:mannan endo-1,4-beta-mannosidase